MITCRDCVKALYPYIDRELSDDDIEHVRQHIEACAGCLHIFQFEESVRRLVRVRCLEQGAPDSLRAKISLRLETERIRLEEAVRRRSRPSF